MAINQWETALAKQVKAVYGEKFDAARWDAFMDRVRAGRTESRETLDEKNVYLITYGDSFQAPGEPTLKTLHRFLKEEVGGGITDVHILPMFEYTSDDGFSVVDYHTIDPALGSWNEVEDLAGDYRLMFDYVVNHVSKSSRWFQQFLKGDPAYQDYFIERSDDFDTSRVIRPRTLPLFHTYDRAGKPVQVWTTFSEDQVDLNFHSFAVFMEISEILLDYVDHGASSIRLDAIGFIWKESGTTCMSLEKTHALIRCWKSLLEQYRPGVQIITETNVPHAENVSYFGDGRNEADMVYQFALPPLVLHTFTTHDSARFMDWLTGVGKVSDRSTYFNFLASHDGVGLRPVETILSAEEKERLVQKVLANGGRVSMKDNPDGTKSVYEMNINYMDALCNPEDDTLERRCAKMLAAHSILMTMPGVPAIYYHSLLGSGNDYRGLEESGINRRINRQKLQLEQLHRELAEDPRRRTVFGGLRAMMDLRAQEPALNPYNDIEPVNLGSELIAYYRIGKDGRRLLFVCNVCDKPVTVHAGVSGEDRISSEKVQGEFTMAPYQYRWILCD